MTDHADISRRLALAIGWDEGRVAVRGGTTVWCLEKRDGIGHGWRPFDYRDPDIIWPIAERYNCWPHLSAWANVWSASMQDDLADLGVIRGDTAAEAVARAVIGGAR